MNKTYVITTILILLLIVGSCIQKNRMEKKEVGVWCTEYVKSVQPSDKTDQEIYEQCMEIYGYGKNN